jgi:hypothetical protein
MSRRSRTPSNRRRVRHCALTPAGPPVGPEPTFDVTHHTRMSAVAQRTRAPRVLASSSIPRTRQLQAVELRRQQSRWGLLRTQRPMHRGRKFERRHSDVESSSQVFSLWRSLFPLPETLGVGRPVTNPIYRTRQWQSVRKQVLSRDQRQCQIRGPRCRGVATCVDHIVELEDGGDPYSLCNLQAACGSCNASKRTRHSLDEPKAAGGGSGDPDDGGSSERFLSARPATSRIPPHV